MIVIYPNDRTTEYLSPVISEGLGDSLSVIFKEFTDDTFDEILDSIQKISNNLSVLYLGHGSEEELKLNINNPLHYNYAKEIFKNKKLFLVSCFSADYITNLNGVYEVAIGFGNIIDSKADLSYKDYQKYNHDNYNCIYQFSKNIVAIIISCLVEACTNEYTYLQLFYELKLRMNKRIALCSLSQDKTTRLLGELMFDLKKNMILKGNVRARLKN